MARKSRKNMVQEEAKAIVFQTALYIRLSVEDNNNKGNSIETQRKILENYVNSSPEFTIFGLYCDNGKSGKTTKRPEFQRLLSDIEANKVNCVIVKDLSRLNRNSIDAGYFIEKYFPLQNVRFISIADDYDSNAEGQNSMMLMLPIKNLIHEAYALDIGRKIKAQQRQSMKDGKYVGGRALYGYVKEKNDCHKLCVDPESAAVVQQGTSKNKKITHKTTNI